MCASSFGVQGCSLCLLLLSLAVDMGRDWGTGNGVSPQGHALSHLGSHWVSSRVGSLSLHLHCRKLRHQGPGKGLRAGRGGTAVCCLPRYGCCPDGVSVAEGPQQAGCTTSHGVEGTGNRPGSRAVLSRVSVWFMSEGQESVRSWSAQCP